MNVTNTSQISQIDFRKSNSLRENTVRRFRRFSSNYPVCARARAYTYLSEWNLRNLQTPPDALKVVKALEWRAAFAHARVMDSPDITTETGSNQTPSATRDAHGRFRKGASPNPGGRPKLTPDEAEVRQIARAHGKRAIRRLVELMEGSDARVAAMAASALLDRGYGKAPQALEVTTRKAPGEPQPVTAAQVLDAWRKPPPAPPALPAPAPMPPPVQTSIAAPAPRAEATQPPGEAPPPRVPPAREMPPIETEQSADGTFTAVPAAPPQPPGETRYPWQGVTCEPLQTREQMLALLRGEEDKS